MAHLHGSPAEVLITSHRPDGQLDEVLLRLKNFDLAYVYFNALKKELSHVILRMTQGGRLACEYHPSSR